MVDTNVSNEFRMYYSFVKVNIGDVKNPFQLQLGNCNVQRKWALPVFSYRNESGKVQFKILFPEFLMHSNPKKTNI